MLHLQRKLSGSTAGIPSPVPRLNWGITGGFAGMTPPDGGAVTAKLAHYLNFNRRGAVGGATKCESVGAGDRDRILPPGRQVATSSLGKRRLLDGTEHNVYGVDFGDLKLLSSQCLLNAAC